MMHQATATMPTPHFSLRGTHHIALAILMTMEALRHGQIGPLRTKTTGAIKKDTRITIKHRGYRYRRKTLNEKDSK